MVTLMQQANGELISLMWHLDTHVTRFLSLMNFLSLLDSYAQNNVNIISCIPGRFLLDNIERANGHDPTLKTIYQ